ncbi:hypothetical protein P3T76_001523 [Phytophthora citrophthora]|uniref:HAT C-terminal dimerisation domain-containing protein n=1 Tax=Phytophthora citrophthora TaxID=4793 RepID=A0AAD9LS24_9STRA|nr:hypothetical protein P3T76_001523 [Phytophthora citrophthora]
MDPNGLVSLPNEAARRPRGRPPSRAWAFFTPITEPQKQISAACRHCNQLVNYHKKWAQARAHLMKCAQFLQLVDSMPSNDVPQWYLAEVSRRQQPSHSKAQSKPMPNIPAVFLQNQTPTQIQTPLKAIQHIPVANGVNMSTTNGALVDQKKFDENVAMHLLTTISVEKLFEDKLELPFLQTLLVRGDVKMPSMNNLMTEMLDQCYDRVKDNVQGFFKSGLVPGTLSVDAVTGGGHSMSDYMATLASSHKYPMYLESVKSPRSGDAGANAEMKAQDIARVVEKLSTPVAGCVMACSTAEDIHTRQLLEKQFPAMYFHGCMRDALLSIVRQLFATDKGSLADRKPVATVPFAQELQQFALQCKDLGFFLPHKKIPSYLQQASEGTGNMIHLTARRRLTVEEAFIAILQAEPFLDVDNVLDRLFSGGGNSPSGSNCSSHLQTQLVKIVRSPQFVEKLRKYLDVLRPIHELFSSLDDGKDTLLLSEAYSSFSRLMQQLGSLSSLEDEEKVVLQALARQQQESCLGSAHLLAYLLDPVLLGEDLPPETKTEVEQKLMASLRGDGSPLSDSDKEALYTQYMDFKKTSSNQKTNKADTIAFRVLKERKTSPLQFWLAEGSKWPVLQAIACRIFVMPVCATRLVHAASEAAVSPILLRRKTDLSTSDKLTYVRVNSRQLQLIQGEGSSLAAFVKKRTVETNPNDITASMVV